ncbi:hypothetical protein [Paenibacillus pinistramenti]|uniref:hypothetical protein n=1 Tax=Paenibacillus pinistramenti TaxID=1768003 RepID=UPI001396A67E|nr:hypothetical protein [Paenibacillus pinistramenti]
MRQPDKHYLSASAASQFPGHFREASAIAGLAADERREVLRDLKPWNSHGRRGSRMS